MPASKPRSFADSGVRRQYAPTRTHDIRHIQLDIRIDDRKRHIAATATLSWTALHEDLTTIAWDLASCMHVQEVRAGKRRLRWEHINEQLHIHLPRVAGPGQQMEISVDYEGQPRRGLWFTGPDKAHPKRPTTVWSQGQDEDSRYWFPCWDSPHDKFTSEVRVTVRAPFTVISNGRLQGVTENKRRRTRTFHWKEDFPHPSYLLSVVVGEFSQSTETVDGVELQYHVHASDKKTVPLLFGRTPEMLRYFNKVIDYPYPYEKYSQTLVPEFIFGGMENISATTLTDSIVLDAIAAKESFTDWLVAHELAHQWWGNLLTCKEWSHAWLNEGFATYFEALFTEHHLGREVFQWQMQTQADDYFSEDSSEYRRPLVERRWHKPIEIFDSHLYEKGSLVLHMLRFELGDELFWKAIRHYVRRYQFQNVETTDFKVAIEEATGRSMDLFFEQWVHQGGFPELETSWEWRQDDKHVALRVQQTHETNESTPLFDFPLEIELGFGDKTERLRVRVRNVEETFHLTSGQRPLYVRIDPDHCLLKKMKYSQGREELLSQLEHATDFLGQSDAAAGLERFTRDPDVVRALTQALRRSAGFPTRRALAKALGTVGGEQARDHLLGALRHRDVRARRGFVDALGSFRNDDKVTAALQKLWKSEKSYIVRASIIRSLVRLRADGAMDVCKAALKEESYRDMVRAAGLSGLAQLEEEAGIGLALPWAAPGVSRWSRDAAMQTLATLARLYRAQGRMVQDLLEDTLRDESFFAQLSAAKALGILGRASAVPALQRSIDGDTDGRVAKTARKALARLSENEAPEAWKTLREEVAALRKQNHDLRSRIERLEGRMIPTSRSTHRRQSAKGKATRR